MSWHDMSEWTGKTLLKDWWDKVRDNLAFLKNNTDTNTRDISTINTNIGTLADLTTTDKSDIVGAISETDTETKRLYHYGDMSVVPTSADKFTWLLGDNVASIIGYTGEDTDVVIPYEYKSGGRIYPVDALKESSFFNSDIQSIIIPKGIESIDANAFSSCGRLTSITIPDSVTIIGSAAFKNCDNLTSITIPDGVTSIGAYTFENCTALRNAVIPDSVTTIGTDAFATRSIPGVNFVIICSQGSAAETYAKNNNISVKYDIVSLDGISEDISIEVSARQNADTALQNQIGTLANLNTSTKDSLVAASNEIMTRLASESAGRQGADGALQNQMGDLTDLDTSTKNDLVGAINELATVKQNKVTITSDTTSAVATLEMANNTEKRFGELTSLTLTLPNVMPDDYISSVIFTSGNIPTNLFYPDTIKTSGEDCIDGVFIPIPDKIYELNFKNVGSCVWCVVGGVE